MKTAVARFLATISLFGNLAIAVSLKAQAPPIPSQQTFRSAVDLVTIQASVRDKHGRPLRDLTPIDGLP